MEINYTQEKIGKKQHLAYTYGLDLLTQNSFSRALSKSQMYRLRRLCSRDIDFTSSIANLKRRCINSGYDKQMVNNVLEKANTLKRELIPIIQKEKQDMYKIKWITLSNSHFEKEVTEFVTNINNTVKDYQVSFELIKTTGPSIGSLLFNNFDKPTFYEKCISRCQICDNNSRGENKKVVSTVTGKSYNIDPNINCLNSGIYGITCKCKEQYEGKTTVTNGVRYHQHWTKNTTFKEHLNVCKSNPTLDDVKIQFLENVWNRGKYSLSEREYLWNKRLKGTINVQKTLKT